MYSSSVINRTSLNYCQKWTEERKLEEQAGDEAH